MRVCNHYYISKIHFKLFMIIIINSPNPTKWIALYICENTISGKMKENNPQQIIVLPTKAIKRLQKNGIIWCVKHVFVKGFIYKQGFTYMSGKIGGKKNVKILMKNWLVKFIEQEMQILHAKILIKHFRKIDENLCSMLNLVQKFIIIVALSYGPNIQMEL